jgi:hypothetical protein
MATMVKREDLKQRQVAGTTVPKASDKARERRLWIIGLCVMVALMVARGVLAQVKRLRPNPALPATFYVANPPYTYKEVLLFNTGLDLAMSMVYYDWTNIQGYSLAEVDAQVNAALAGPSKNGPNPIFLWYENGKMVAYPSLRALVNAGK